MQNNYNNEEKKELRDINRGKKYSKLAFYAGIAGLSLTALNYFVSGEPSLQTLKESFDKMNHAQMVDTTIFSISSFATIGGGIFYGWAELMREDYRDFISNKRKRKKRDNLEKELNKSED